jgi:phosphate transport system substrate-binding protein
VNQHVVGIGIVHRRTPGKQPRRLLIPIRLGLSLLTFCVLALAQAGEPQNSEPVRLVGVGSTSPLSAFVRLLPEFEKAHPDIHANYLPFGSERGLEMVAAGTADFGASEAQAPIPWPFGNDVPLSYFPVLAGAAVPVYNVPEVSQPLRFTAKALAGIYLGKITRWDDPELAAANRGAALPAIDIVVIHSAPGRGSTYVWTEYLCKVSTEWRTRVGKGLVVKWPVGTEADANGNVARMVKNTAYSLAFVDLGYAVRGGLSSGLVQNAAGKFVAADSDSIAAAAATTSKNLLPDFRYSITNAPGQASYPIASFTWIVIARTTASAEKRQAVKDLLRWLLLDGQIYLTAAGFAAVPKRIAEKELLAIDSLP